MPDIVVSKGLMIVCNFKNGILSKMVIHACMHSDNYTVYSSGVGSAGAPGAGTTLIQSRTRGLYTMNLEPSGLVVASDVFEPPSYRFQNSSHFRIVEYNGM